MSSETAAAFGWVDATMRADSALMAASRGGIWLGMAATGTQPPFAVYNRQSGADVMTLAAVRLWADILVQIKAIGPVTNYAALVVIADRIDALFANVRTVALAQGGILSCYREQEVAMDEVVGGAQWSHLGGLYRIALMSS